MRPLLPAMVLLTGLAGSVSAPRALANRPRDLLEEGHQRMEAGQSAEALARYQEAARAAEGTRLDPSVALYNAARALAGLGRREEAAEVYGQSLESGHAGIQVPARYNLANAHQQMARALAESSPEQARQALPGLEEAMAAYRDAMLLDPADEDLKANFELADRLKEAIEALPPPPPQPQDPQDPESDPESSPEPQDPSDPSDPGSPQNPPENPTPAPQDPGQEEDPSPPPEAPRPESPRMTPEDAARLLDAQRQEEEAYRDQVRRQSVPPEAVEKDW